MLILSLNIVMRRQTLDPDNTARLHTIFVKMEHLNHDCWAVFRAVSIVLMTKDVSSKQQLKNPFTSVAVLKTTAMLMKLSCFLMSLA
jgi:hypothetical protein